MVNEPSVFDPSGFDWILIFWSLILLHIYTTHSVPSPHAHILIRVFAWRCMGSQDSIASLGRHQRMIHYENTPIQIYWKFHLQKTENIQIINSDIFHISAQNVDCGYLLEPPRWDGSNKYSQSLLLSRNKKNNVYPCKPQYIENFTSKNWKFSDNKLWYFSYFCSKHRLWVLVRTASMRRF